MSLFYIGGEEIPSIYLAMKERSPMRDQNSLPFTLRGNVASGSSSWCLDLRGFMGRPIYDSLYMNLSFLIIRELDDRSIPAI